MLLQGRDSYTPKQRVELARNPLRPNVKDYIKALFDEFFETSGDRLYGDDRSVITGIAEFGGIPVTVAGHVKGHDLESNIACNFGMPNPEGYRKFQRAILQAEKFFRPVITFIDTPGAYPGTGAEERGQGDAIAKCLYMLSSLKTPVVAVVTGEGGSGGALAFSVADKILMLENAVYSILSPEGFASILWKDAGRSAEASEVMKLTAFDLYDYKICDRIIKEPEGGAHRDYNAVFSDVHNAIRDELAPLLKMRPEMLTQRRYKKFRSIGI